jgi:hypothetical protein
VEVPVNHRPRRFGVSKYGLGNRALRATLDMFGVRWLQSRTLNLAVNELEETTGETITSRSGILGWDSPAHGPKNSA